MYYHKRRVEWWLAMRIFDYVAVSGVGIVNVKIKTTNRMAKVYISIED